MAMPSAPSSSSTAPPSCRPPRSPGGCSWRRAGPAKAPFKALVGGEALPKDLADQLIARGVELWNMYGPTETTVWSTCARITDTANGITIGKPIANTTVYILDAQKNLCPIGVPGELCIGGDGVSLGYWNRPELTADRFIPDPFSTTPGARLYRTGDRARWRNDGTLEHLGRLDFQVKIRGYRIELGEIETAHRQPSGDSRGGGRGARGRPGGSAPGGLLRGPEPAGRPGRSVARSVARGPARVHGALRVRRSGGPAAHPQRQGRSQGAAGARAARTAARRPAYVAPRTATEEILAGIWAEVLGLERVGIEDNFFELGGHSLLAMQVVFARAPGAGNRVAAGEFL